MHVDMILKSKGTTVYTVTRDASMAEAVRLLNSHKIGALVVVDPAGRVAGILSERDVVRHMTDRPQAMLDRPVHECMTSKVISATRVTTVAELMGQMTRHRVRHIPVVEDGKLLGIVSIGDVVKRKIEEAEGEAAALRDYIAS
jgi:CBS domain-containing protein